MKDTPDSVATTARRLNHVEFVHLPNESALVIDLFEALGCPCSVIDTPPYGKYVVVSLDKSPHGENDIFVSELEPEQLALETALRGLIDGGHDGATAAGAAFHRLRKERPYRVTHIGLRIPSVAQLDSVIEHLRALSTGKLAGRLELGEVFARDLDEARRTSSPLKQIWIWTDAISTGLLTVGQQIELQAYDF